jgi:hypothetical protein
MFLSGFFFCMMPDFEFVSKVSEVSEVSEVLEVLEVSEVLLCRSFSCVRRFSILTVVPWY